MSIKETKFYQWLISCINLYSALKLEYLTPWHKDKYGYFAKNAAINTPFYVSYYPGMFLYENTNIYGHSKFILAPGGGRFIMKKNSGCAMGLTVVTGNHSTYPTIGKWHKEDFKERKGDVEKDIVVEEDVWLAANVTLLAGTTVGRGSVVGVGAVVRQSLPPYSICIGNPAKVIGFKFTPEEIIKHEEALYSVDERLPLALLEHNYEKYYCKKIKDIVKYLKL